MTNKFAFFGSSQFSEYVLEELEKAGHSPTFKVTNARDPLPELPVDIDLAIVASFGKILPADYLKIPRCGFINIHPSLLPLLRGPSPIQNLILQDKTPGVTVIQVDEKMDHGPILAQEEVAIDPWPDHYRVVEEKLARAGAKLLIRILSNTECLTHPTQDLCNTECCTSGVAQDENRATYTKMVQTSDAEIDLNNDAESNLRKVLAYSTEPGAWFMYKNKNGKDIRVKVKDAKLENCEIENSLKTENCKLKIISVIPAGKKEMSWESFLRGNS